jgi:hypothetical protein
MKPPAAAKPSRPRAAGQVQASADTFDPRAARVAAAASGRAAAAGSWCRAGRAPLLAAGGAGAGLRLLPRARLLHGRGGGLGAATAAAAAGRMRFKGAG